MTDLYGIVFVFGSLLFAIWVFYTLFSLLFHICVKTSNCIGSLFSKPNVTQNEMMLQAEINRINQEYMNMVEEHRKTQNDVNKMMY